MMHERFIFTRKLLEQKISALKKKKQKLEDKCNEDPFTELTNLRNKAHELINDMSLRSTAEFRDFFEGAAAKEKRLKKRINEQLKGGDQKYWDQVIEIESQIRELHNAIYRLR